MKMVRRWFRVGTAFCAIVVSCSVAQQLAKRPGRAPLENRVETPRRNPTPPWLVEAGPAKLYTIGTEIDLTPESYRKQRSQRPPN